MMKSNEQELTVFLKQIKDYFDLIDASTDAYLFATDITRPTIMISPRLVKDFGLPSNVVTDFDQYWIPLIHPHDRKIFLDSMTAMMVDRTTDSHDCEYRIKDVSGEYIWLRCRGRVKVDDNGNPIIFAGVMARMSERSQADFLTGLLNKKQFKNAVEQSLRIYKERGTHGAVMLLGMDNFKIINEAYGRKTGDEIMKKVAQQLENMLPDSLPLYKLDGDEFAVVLPGATKESVASFYNDVQTYMARTQFIGDKVFFCTMSAGTAFYPESGKEYEKLHRYAEVGLDMAKQSGKNRNVIMNTEQYRRWERSVEMRDALQECVERGCENFQLFYQPQVNAETKQLIGAEALLRWKNPNTGRMVSPMEFVPVLEQTKMMLPVGRWIVGEALRQCKEWQKVIPDFHMSINVSYVQIKDPDFFETVAKIIEELGIAPSTVTLELTESVIVSDWTYLNERFREFQSKGIAIAMDDFGTGYSSLAYLKNLSCDIVKIDRAFMKEITDSEFDKKLVEYTVQLCHSANMHVCIEGVEEHDVYEVVAGDCRADYIQGYLFGRPESVEDFEKDFLLRQGELPEAKVNG